MLNIDATTSAQHWAFGTADGGFSRTGAIAFPIRGVLPQVALRDRAAHVMAIGDIVEPNEAWRAFKKQKTGRDWDYVFRRLFYTTYARHHADRLLPAGRDRHGRGHRRPHQPTSTSGSTRTGRPISCT